jgi:hypothetical protein
VTARPAPCRRRDVAEATERRGDETDRTYEGDTTGDEHHAHPGPQQHANHPCTRVSITLHLVGAPSRHAF